MVKTNANIPKDKIFQCTEEINKVRAPRHPLRSEMSSSKMSVVPAWML